MPHDDNATTTTTTTTTTMAAEAEPAATTSPAKSESKPRRTRKKAAAAPAAADPDVTTSDEAAAPKTVRRPRKAASKRTADPAAEPVESPTVPATAGPVFQAPDFAQVEPVPEPGADPAAEPATGEPGDDDAPRRRRRRGGRGRRKKGPGDAAEPGNDDDAQPAGMAADGQGQTTATGDAGSRQTEPADPDPADSADDAGTEEGADSAAASRRRRRRRRRKGEPDDTAVATDDPPDTVMRIREPRADIADEVTSVKGSTRLEAKKQRRREGREAGRRRAPVISEAEFLARREAVDRVMVVRQTGARTQIGVLEDGVLVEHYVSRSAQESMVGNVYLGRVQNVLPAMEAAFVDVGRGRNAILYAGDVDWVGLGKPDGPRRIEDVLKSGQSVLVQVTKDPIGHKGSRLTGQVSLAGRYVVFVPGGSMSGISRKLPENERDRLKKILKQVVPDDSAVIVRTAAEGASEEELTHDVARLRAQWDDIAKKVSGSAPQLLYSEPDLAIKVVRDLFNEDFSQLVISGDDAWDTIEAYVAYVASSLRDRLERWTGDGDVFAAYRIDEQIAKALERKVWLPSGGSLVIDRTEAMTVIDVNTGKFTGSGGNLEETVTKNNLEAAEEIVRQLRLRDIGGIIVIDFIDMVLEANRDLVLRRLIECLGRDRTKHQVAEVTSLGLVQMTRKRIGTDLLEAFSEPCEHCNGRGLHIHVEPVEPAGKPAPANGNGGRGGRRRREKPPSAQQESEEVAPLAAEVDTSVEADEFDDLEPLSVDDVDSAPPEPETSPAPSPAPRRSRRRAVRPAGEPDAHAESAARETGPADVEPVTV